MKKTSKKLNGWADTLIAMGVVMVAIAVISWLVSDGDTSVALLTGISLIISSAVLRGLSVIVQNAEDQIEERNEHNERPL